MRGYVGMTAQEVSEFLASGECNFTDVYAPTAQFIAAHTDLDEEEVEYTLSMVAAEDALELKDANSGAACVLAFEIPSGAVSESHEMSVSLSQPLKWENLECLFEVSDDGEDLTWFATQEIAPNIAGWLR